MENGKLLLLHLTLRLHLGSRPSHAAIRGSGPRRTRPPDGVIDSQTVKTTEVGSPKGYNARKKVSDRQRHLLVDTLRLIWELAVLLASPTNWDGSICMFERVGEELPHPARVLTDAAYQALTGWTSKNVSWVLDIMTCREG